MKITFYGGAQTVTGSKYLIQTGDYNLLLDCGLHQGRRSESNKLNKNFSFPAEKVNAVILSHAHADHCGMLPVLVKEGFKGKIYCTAATAEIAKFILEDSANVQKNDALYYNKHLKPGESPVEPIYTEKEVKNTFSHFNPVPYFRLSKKWTNLNENIRFKFYDAGHILGSVVTLLEIKDPSSPRSSGHSGSEEQSGSMRQVMRKIKRLVFTGDLGRHFLPILRDPEPITEEVDNLIIEATYGGRTHKPISDLKNKLKSIILEAIKNKSKIIVPSFSLGRTQELIYALHKLLGKKTMSPLPIFIDSPLSKKITGVFDDYTSNFDEEFWEDFGEDNINPFLFEGMTIVGSVQESKSINQKKGPLLVVAGSGMCEGGRVLHHLKNSIEDSNNVILITGYQAEHTLGRKILENISPVKIFGKEYNVKAKVIALNELSAHADQKDLLSYTNSIKGLKNVFLVHSELRESAALKGLMEEKIPNLSVNIPSFGEEFEI